VLETEIAGVDLLPAADGRLLVLEINAVPGWRALETVVGGEVAGTVARYLEGRLAR
jgi:glutathione synthase/RimK-type ligase-like ATP-grasp enzyme